jgi:diphosphomevalonate decarboxylase
MSSNNEVVVYMAIVSAPTNIAVIKYWGKASKEYNTPINSSLSVTLDQADLRAVTTVAASPSFTQDRLWLNGTEDLRASESKRFRACIDGVKALATTTTTSLDGTVVTADEWKQWKVHVSSYNTFPTAAGLASSAAGYAALVAALAELYQAKESFVGELSTIARQGSGSACRSLYGGFVAWRMGSATNGWLDSKAEPIGAPDHWPEMRAVILVVSDQKKDTSSTAGMSTSVATSTLLQHRAAHVVPQRMKDMEQAWLNKDFQTFGKITMQDSNQFHATCLDTYPPIFYTNDTSRDIIRLVTAYNAWAGEIRAAYTFDAGPNAVLYILEPHLLELVALMLRYFPAPSGAAGLGDSYMNKATELRPQLEKYQLEMELVKACDKTGRVPATVAAGTGDVKHIYVTKWGPGPQVLTAADATLDPKTGLNTYQKPDPL